MDSGDERREDGVHGMHGDGTDVEIAVDEVHLLVPIKARMLLTSFFLYLGRRFCGRGLHVL